MKKLKALYFGIAALALSGLASCQAEMDAPDLVEPTASMQSNTTISELKTIFASSAADLCPMKDAATNTPYIIHGRVISSDATGNIYKSLVIQDETAAIALSINQGSMYTDFPLGQEVVLNVTGLYVGNYNGLQQIGWLGEYSGEPCVTFMPWSIFRSHCELNGFPTTDVKYLTINDEYPTDLPYCIITSFSQLPSSGEAFRNMQSQLVEFRNVYFEDGGKEIYAPYQESVNRNICDASGSTLIVRTSGYSNFYNETLPEGTGTVRGILSYYGDSWQLLLRSLDDVMISAKGQKADPYTVEEAIEIQSLGYSGWVTGYIVGSVKAGVEAVTSNDDVIFGPDAELPNNILVASSPSVSDWTQCIAVALPQGSDFRAAVNLVDHPEVLGKAILVSGTLTKLYGMPGITGNGGTSSDVEVDGVTIGSGSVGGGDTQQDGNGTQSNPYSISQVQNSTTDQSDVWVEGYVVGYIPAMTWGEAIFGNTPTDGSTNWSNGTNIVLSSSPVGSANAGNSIPVGLATAVRETLAISKNAAIYGAKVRVKGSMEKYFGIRGIKSVSDFEIIEGGSGSGSVETPDNPSDDKPEGAVGDGTEANPYNIAYVQGSSSDSTDVWIVGYVAGYVPGMVWSDATFGSTPDTSSDNFNNATNCILSDVAPTGSNADNSVPCGLKNTGNVRTTLGISKNPDIYGKKVMVKGEITKYFGIRGIKNVSDFKILE